MKPGITKPEHIAQCVTQRRRWRGQERIDVLEQCTRMIQIWQRAGRITRQEAAKLRMKVAPALTAEKKLWQEKQENSLAHATRTTPRSSGGGRKKVAQASSTDGGPSAELSTKSAKPGTESISSKLPASGRRRCLAKKPAPSERDGSLSTSEGDTSNSEKTETANSGSDT